MAGLRSGADSGEAGGARAYERGETDEFIEPTLVGAEADPTWRQRAVLQLPARSMRADRALAEQGFGEEPERALGMR